VVPTIAKFVFGFSDTLALYPVGGQGSCAARFPASIPTISLQQSHLLAVLAGCIEPVISPWMSFRVDWASGHRERIERLQLNMNKFSLRGHTLLDLERELHRLTQGSRLGCHRQLIGSCGSPVGIGIL